jgi:SOS response regulatory protein OraA/RecX
MENGGKNKVEIDVKQLKNKCLRLLTKRDHSSLELLQKMRRYYVFSPEDFTAALDWLKELKYLPAETVMAQRLAKHYRAQGRGRQWIRGKLRLKGLSTELGDDDDETKAAEVMLDKKLRHQNYCDLDFKQKQRLARQLSSRGFSHSVVRELLKQRDQKK